MLINGSKLINVPVLSLQEGGAIAWTDQPIIDPDALKVIGFKTRGTPKNASILDFASVREFSRYGMVVDSSEELVSPSDVIKIEKVLALNFNLLGCKVESKKGTKLGKVSGYTCTDDNLSIQQIIVQKPMMKSFLDAELTIPRKQIIEVTDTKIIVKDEEKAIRQQAEEDFVPNFVNPFRKSEPNYAPIQNQNPDAPDIG